MKLKFQNTNEVCRLPYKNRIFAACEPKVRWRENAEL